MFDIQELLGQIPAEILKRQKKKQIMKEQFERYSKEIVIYGHGNLGGELRKGLENAGWPVRYFIDANQPTNLADKVLNLQDANRYLTPDALIIVAIYDLYLEYASIQEALKEKGFKNVWNILDLRVWPELFQAGHFHSALSWEIDTIPAEQVQEAYGILEDAASRQVYEELLRYFITDTMSFSLCPCEQQYMPDGVYQPGSDEHIVDCGAYNGDTMRAFYSALGGWQSYTAIEPDRDNLEKLCGSAQRDLPACLSERTRAVQAAVSDEAGTAVFCAKGSTSSHISTELAGQMQSVPIVKLDDIIQGPVSLIKMDVEGFELRALQGAEGLILANQPLLAICGYHQQSDLWQIPLYMKKICPDYHIFLRNYVGMIEYVFYAVPENRVLPQ